MPNSPNKGYVQPSYNSFVGSWGDQINSNFSSIVDSNLGGATSVSLSNANVTLSSAQAQNLTVYLSGTLSANVTVSTPCIGFFWIINNTTGNYTVSLQANFGSGNVGSAVLLPQGGVRQLFVSDTSSGLQYGAAPASIYLPGELKAYAGSSAPSGWLLCYGQAISRSIYAPLYAVIGTTYGAGDGSLTFNIPDLRGRTIFGLDNMGGSAAGRLTGGYSGSISSPTTLGASGGEEAHVSTVNETASHGHADTGHGHVYIRPTPPVGYSYQSGGFAGTVGTSSWTDTGYANIQNTGGNAAHNNMPPGVVMNWLIRAF